MNSKVAKGEKTGGKQELENAFFTCRRRTGKHRRYAGLTQLCHKRFPVVPWKRKLLIADTESSSDSLSLEHPTSVDESD